jgi:hypothetical protein
MPKFLPFLLVFGVSVTAGCDRQQPPSSSADKGNPDGQTASTKSPSSDPATTPGEAKMNPEPRKRDLVVTRAFDAPVEQV